MKIPKHNGAYSHAFAAPVVKRITSLRYGISNPLSITYFFVHRIPDITVFFGFFTGYGSAFVRILYL